MTSFGTDNKLSGGLIVFSNYDKVRIAVLSNLLCNNVRRFGEQARASETK